MPARKKKNPAESALEAFTAIGELRNLPSDVVESAMSDAMEKAYRKHSGLEDAAIETQFKDGILKIFQKLEVVDDVEDDEFQISLADAKKIKPDAEIGETVLVEIDPGPLLGSFERGDIAAFKSVMKQKIREYEKEEVLKNYKDKVEELVTGIVESVEDRFVLVRLGGTPEGKPQPGSTLAMMRHADQIPTEHYTEGQPLPVVISKVDKESKGALVLVSRSDPSFVKRLFEKEVPEIYQGIIEIKAIARDPGARAKMAVYSRNENIDPIGACIGPRGSRVQAIINELNGEKIDIFEWSDDLQQLVANALSPAQGVEVFPSETVQGLLDSSKPQKNNREGREGRTNDNRKALVAAVPENQLSLAIGKKGQNAKLAFKLTGHRIDIRSQEELDQLGIDWRSLVKQMHDEYVEKKEAERAYKQQQRIEEIKNASVEDAEVSMDEFSFAEDFDDEHLSSLETLAAAEETSEPEVQEETVKEETVEEQPKAEAAPAEKPEEEPVLDEMEQAARLAKINRKSLAERRSEYVSKLEQPEKAESSEENKPAKPAHKSWKKHEPARDEKPAKKKPVYNTLQPIYTEDELAEIEENELEEEMNASWNDDVDYEEYDSYYDDEY